MPSEWNDTYATGIVMIDEQHRELFRRVGTLFDAIRSGQDTDQVPRMLEFLTDYTRDHFRDEEQLMAAHGYQFLALHRAEHQALVHQLADWIAGGAGEDLRLTMELACILNQWLSGHIVRSDMAFVPFILRGRKAA